MKIPLIKSMHSVRSMRILTLLTVLLILSAGTGCRSLRKSVRASLSFDSYVAVKVPGGETQIPTDVVSTNGWKFLHLASCAYETTTDDGLIVPDAPSQWYLAFKMKDGKPEHVPWFLARRSYAKAREWLPDIADATKAKFGVYPTTLEVVNVLDAQDKQQEKKESEMKLKMGRSISSARTASTKFEPMVLGTKPHPSWPTGSNVLWHLGTNYSQLTVARERVKQRQGDGPWRVKVGILDTGFSGTHGAMPRFIDESNPTNSSAPCKDDAWNLISCALSEEGSHSRCRSLPPSETHGDHPSLSL